jgi:galactose oxidase
LKNDWKRSRRKGGEPDELHSNASRRLREYPRRFGRDCFWLAFPLLVVVAVLLVSRSGPHRSGSTAVNPSGMAGMTATAFEKAMAHMVHPTRAAYVADAPTLVPEGWTVAASSHSAGHHADAVLDSNSASYWSNRPSSGQAALPQSVTIDMRGRQLVSGLTYQPRQGAHPAGAIGRFKVRVSKDGVHFVTVASGTWANTTAPKHIGIAPVRTRFVRLVALSFAAGSGRSVSAAGISLQGNPHVQAPLAKSLIKASTLSTNPSVVGQWGPTIGFPLVPVAAAPLPNNMLLVWSANEDNNFFKGPTYTQTALLNLNTGTVSQVTVSNTNHDMFCPGTAILPNGDIMVTGGLSSQQTSIYVPATNSWIAGPQMNIGRGYQGMTLLSNGQAFVLGGSWSGALGGKLGEVWSPTGNWRELTNVPATPMYTADPQGVYRQDNHGWFIATSGGKVLQAGPSKQMNWITTTGSGAITPAGNRGNSADAMNGNAVYYDINKIITMGGAPAYQGSSPATNQANEIDISNGTANVTQVGSMNYPRAFANSVVLPDGEVVTVGGQTQAAPFSDTNSVLNAEMWNPATGQFTLMAPEAEPRNYHSVAVLLPDGRLFSGGGGLCGTCSTNHPDGQIFSPPYLFNSDGSLRTRPTITSAPASAATGQTISVTTGGSVSSFSMVRYGVATHSVDNDQRRIPLQIVSSSGNTYQLAIPSNPGIALPGPYMLFALDSNGTPSISSTISITNVASQPPTDGYGQAVYSAGPLAYWPLNDASGPTAADLSGNGDTANYSATGIGYGAPSPVEGASGTGVTLDGSSGQIVASQPITNPTTYSEEMWFKTTSTKGGYLMGFGNAPSGQSGSRDRMVFMSNNGQLHFGIHVGTGNNLEIGSPGSYNDGKWHQVVATEGADGLNLYVDGQLVANNSTTSLPQNYLGYWRVGYESLLNWPNAPADYYFAGTVSDVAFYNSELSGGQVQTHYQAAGATPPPPGCPTAWSCNDIGSPLPAGQDSLSGDGTWSEIGGGTDIWGTSDSFHLVSQSLSGDGIVSAQVTSQQNTSAWAKAGVMMRASIDPGAPYYAAFITPGHGVDVQWRPAQGATTSQLLASGTAPVYLRVGRYTTTGSSPVTYYTAYTSSDGNTWTPVAGSTKALSLPGPLLAGFAITSHNQGKGCAVTLNSVAVTPGEVPPPGV